MSVELRPYQEFEAAKLAEELQNLVAGNDSYLRERNLFGVIDRYGGDPEVATANVSKGQAEHHRLGHFALMSSTDSNKLIGLASIYPGLLLKKHSSVRTVEFPYASPHIQAWTDINDGSYWGLSALTSAYSQLKEMALLSPWRRHDSLAWTLEPAKSNKAYHEAITDAGLVEIATAAYDDGEINPIDKPNKFVAPSQSTLYAAFYGQCVSHSTRRKERRLKRVQK